MKHTPDALLPPGFVLDEQPKAAEDWSDLAYPVSIGSDGSVLFKLRPAKAPTHELHMGAPLLPSDQNSKTPLLDSFFAQTRNAH